MQVIQLLNQAFATAEAQDINLSRRWKIHSWVFGSRYGAHLNLFQDANMDLLLRSIENEILYSSINAVAAPPNSVDIIISFSEYWLIRVYESVRAASQIAFKRNEPREKLISLRDKLELVRIPLAKKEIANRKKKEFSTDGLIMERVGEGPVEFRPYKSDCTHIVPMEICGETGSVIWYPFDIRLRQSVAVRRIDLSNEFLAIFD